MSCNQPKGESDMLKRFIRYYRPHKAIFIMDTHYPRNVDHMPAQRLELMLFAT